MTWPPAPPTPPPPPPPAGWYPDPAGQLTQRWWDGAAWTEHVGVLAAPGDVRLQVALDTGAAEFAGWWRRLGGYLIDLIIVDVPVFIIGFVIGLTQRHNFVAGTNFWHLSAAAQVLVVLLSVLVALGYPYLLLRHNGQTVGMMAVGVRAVDQVSGASPTSAQVTRRVLTFFVLVSLGQQIALLIGFHHVFGPVPAAESLFRLLSVAGLATTSLWVLRSRMNQTLQDKAAGTVVVRIGA